MVDAFLDLKSSNSCLDRMRLCIPRKAYLWSKVLYVVSSVNGNFSGCVHRPEQ